MLDVSTAMLGVSTAMLGVTTPGPRPDHAPPQFVFVFLQTDLDNCGICTAMLLSAPLHSDVHTPFLFHAPVQNSIWR